MLYLIFRLDGEAFALDVSRIVEILPLVQYSKTARASSGLRGAINYRGVMAPTVDLAAMMLGRASQPRLSTRIVLVRRASSGDLVGLIAECAVETRRIEPEDFASNSLADSSRAYLGPVAVGPQGPVQRIELDKLLATEAGRSPEYTA